MLARPVMPIAHGLLQEARPEQRLRAQPAVLQTIRPRRTSPMPVETIARSGARKRAAAKSLPHHGIVSACPSHLINVRTDGIKHDSGGKSLHTEGGVAKR
ncbi:hypothetical protein PSHT_14057 [Puccinia striiformis]|uniref:Uncharacterized protein n=2 Tax=Puccinia striiformis TaxID=27350 RepID=A0A0L0VN44_9BASI|nr:hypothetical protein H4Q26_015151 [Puccinia striiformis f. sp. tritici PST-130]KAI9630562.1 hypothetical protein KEM48_013823 [Puccinia striiformis f. sp. tritici PST-130]KNF00703.1 hypothetical protein PSTG_06117 [Puccinia striiformis f. sp. tritici PST-78]POV98368.1 hypothetical protein PSHT_14057 [Puccinia striiformis]